MALTWRWLQAEQSSTREGIGFVLDVVLRSYSQILFSRSRLVGLLLLGATLVSPRAFFAGFACVLLANAVAAVVKLSPDMMRSGLFGYNALLIGLGGAAFLTPSATVAVFIGLAAALSVLVTAAVHSALGTQFSLPALTIPFLLVFYAVLAAAPALGIRWSTHFALDPLAVDLGLGTVVTTYFQSLGAIFFLPRLEAGLIVFVALLVFSRVGFLLSLVGYAIGALVASQVVSPIDPSLSLMLSFNCILAAIALGGVWFVPSPSSFVFAVAGALACGLVTLAAAPVLRVLYFPLLILPFNVVVILLLYAMRQRVRDGQPKAVDFMLGTPEENLHYFRTRVARFGARYALRFRAPFLGRWVCTQGVEGDLTHKGPWRYALDFEVEGPDGERFKGQGKRRTDYLCYKLPVLATADATVVKVIDGVADNPIGEVNLEQNWGNLVILYHAPGLYSLVAHLAPGSIVVREGQVVRAGEKIGACGSSGRSPTPHLHFQLQATARVGAPTLPVELHNVVTEANDEARLHGAIVPAEGSVIRNLVPELDVAALLRFPLGQELTFRVERGSSGGSREYVLQPDIDLYGRLELRTSDNNAVLYYDHGDDLFTVFDTVGPRHAALRLIQMALGRVPFEVSESLRWNDFVPVRHVWPIGVGALLDLASPFLPSSGVELNYTARREGKSLEVTGQSTKVGADLKPVITTRATLTDGVGLERVEVVMRGRTTTAVRIVIADEDPKSRTPPSRSRDRS